jgi:hypothetical protein
MKDFQSSTVDYTTGKVVTKITFIEFNILTSKKTMYNILLANIPPKNSF